MSDDLRIYYGEARIIIPSSDPRAQKILEMVVQGIAAGPPKPSEFAGVPKDDNHLLAILRLYFAMRRHP